jgi:hypothetical protein
MSRYADHLTDVADVLLSTAEGSEVRVNIGEETTGVGIAQDVQVWGPDGFISRPNDPSDKGCAQVLYLAEGQQRRVFATRDNRFAKQAGALDPGDRIIVTDGPPRFFLKQSSQRVGLYTEAVNDPPAGGKGMMLDLSGEDGVIQIRCGGCVLVLDGQNGRIQLSAIGSAGAATLVLDSVNGVSLMGGIANLDCSFVTLGLNSDGTRPGKPGVDTVLLGAVGTAGVASPKIYAAQY